MTQAKSDAKLAEVKLALAGKCDRLAKTVRSVPRRRTLLTQAARFRRQAAALARQS
jgi:hypothetical protein